MDFLSTQQILVHIPLGPAGYDLSWIEAIGALSGLICIWLASQEKIINYLFGLINVVLLAIIFFQIQLYASLLLQLFFFIANLYGWYAWSRQTAEHQAKLNIRWLPLSHSLGWGVTSVIAIGLLTYFIDPFFLLLTKFTVWGISSLGWPASLPELQPDAFPFWDACMTVLSIVAMILMTRKYVENWLLWGVIDVISVAIFIYQGVYVLALEYVVLTIMALNGSWLWIRVAQKHTSS